MNYLAFIMQIFETSQNMLCKSQDKLEGKSWIGQLALQTWNAIAENIRNKTNVSASETLKCKFMEKVNHVAKSVM